MYSSWNPSDTEGADRWHPTTLVRIRPRTAVSNSWYDRSEQIRYSVRRSPSSKEAAAMEFLVYKFFWWVLSAFALGLIVGWLSCSPKEDGRS